MNRSMCLRLPKFNAFQYFRIGADSLLALLIALIVPVAGFAQTTPTYGLRVLSSNFEELPGVTVDSHGNVFAVDGAKQLVYEFLAVNGAVPSNATPRTLGSGYTAPRSIAVDPAGDVFVANEQSIVELMAVNGSVPDNPTIVNVVTLQGTTQFINLTLDGFGNLVVQADGDSSDDVLQVMAVNGAIPVNPTIRTLFSSTPSDLGEVTSDSRGNVYYLYFDQVNTSIYELTAVNGMIPDGATPQPILLEPDPPFFDTFAVDTAGNIFIAEVISAETSALVKVSAVNGVIPANPTITTLYSAPQATFRASSIALDANDNMFIADFFDSSTAVDGISWELAEVAPTGVTLTPSTYNFGSVNVNSSATTTLTLSNTGTSPINIASTSLASQVFTVASTTCAASLGASSTCTYDVEFAPSAAGAQTATFSVTDDAGTQTAALSGTGVADTSPTAPAAALTPSTENFGSVTAGDSSATKTFTLTNSGTASLPITSVAVTGTNASSFKIGTNGCSSSLAAGASCAIAITFNPNAAGSDTASLTVVDSVGTQTSVLTGTGTAAVVADFAIAATPPTQTVAVGNSATYSVNITPSGSFNTAVALTATGLPPGATATFNPASVTPGSTVASSTMTIHTTSLQTVTENVAMRYGGPALAALFLFLPFSRLRKWRAMLCALLFSTTLLLMTGCDGGFGLGTAPKSATTYTVTITGTSGSFTHSTTVQITVTGD